jgi:hypothetical protein
MHQEGRENAISFSRDAYPVKFHSIKIIPTSETQIKNYQFTTNK